MIDPDPWRRRTIWEQYAAVASRWPDKEVLVGVDAEGGVSRVTYADLRDRAERLAAGFHRLGLRRGDRLSLWMTNRIDMAVVFFAALRLGVHVVPMSTWLTPDEARHELAHARSRWLVLVDRFRRRDFTAALEEICPEVPAAVPGELVSPALPELRTVVVAPRDASAPAPPGALSLGDVERIGAETMGDPALAAAVAAVQPADLAAMFYTSGSTGRAKGVLLEQWGIVTKTLLLADRLGLGPDDRMLTPMPFFHVGGSLQALFRLPLLGGTLIFLEAHDPALEIDLIERERCTINYSLFSILHDQVDLLRRTGKRLDVRLTMAVGATAADLRHFMGVRLLFAGWGLSEGYSIQCCCSAQDTQEQQDTSSAAPLPGIQVRAVDPETGADVEVGEVGEGWVRGTVMRGYWQEPELTRQAIDEEGWLHTGDLIRRQAGGRFRYEGRLKAVLKVNGENVSPAEIEAVIRTMAGVEDCCVVGAADDRAGEVPVAFVAAAPSADLTPSRIEAACREALAPFKVPRRIEILAALPILPATSKADRMRLAARARELVAAAPANP